MKLKSEEEVLLRRFIASVEGIVAKYVPSPVPGISKYNQMMNYLDLRNKVIATFFSSKERKAKFRQIDIEEAIANEKKDKL